MQKTEITLNRILMAKSHDLPYGLKKIFVSYYPTSLNCLPLPNFFIAQNIFFYTKYSLIIVSYSMHGIQKEWKKERRKHQIAAYNASSADLNRSRYPTTSEDAFLLYIYI